MNTLKTIVIGFLAGIAGAYAFFTYQIEDGTLSESNKGQFNVASYTPEDSLLPTVVTPRVNSGLANVDFSNAAELAIPSVVYINSISQSGVSYS